MKNYGFSDDQVQSSKGFPLSECVDNVSLEHCEYVTGEQKDGSTYEAIDFQFTRPGGERLKDRMFEVNEEKILPRQGLTLEETINQAYVNFNTRLWHIADGFEIDRDELKDACSAVKNFKEFATAYCKVVNRGSSGKKVYLKTIRSKGGYINLPMFPNFIQPGDQDCTLSWSDYEARNNEKNKKPTRPVQKVSDTDVEEEVAADVYDDDDWLDSEMLE